LVTKVFSARCQKCHKENVYALTEIEDISNFVRKLIIGP
jgi:cytochrome c5